MWLVHNCTVFFPLSPNWVPFLHHHNFTLTAMGSTECAPKGGLGYLDGGKKPLVPLPYEQQPTLDLPVVAAVGSSECMANMEFPHCKEIFDETLFFLHLQKCINQWKKVSQVNITLSVAASLWGSVLLPYCCRRTHNLSLLPCVAWSCENKLQLTASWMHSWHWLLCSSCQLNW